MSVPLTVERCGPGMSVAAGGTVPGAGPCAAEDPGCAKATGPTSNDSQINLARLDIRNLAN